MFVILIIMQWIIPTLLECLEWSRIVWEFCSPRGGNGRLTTNLENLEYSGISMNMENLGYSQVIPCNLRKNV